MAEVRKSGDTPVPLHLRNAPTRLMKDLNYGAEYKYAHSYQGNFVKENYLPEELKGMVFYSPGDNHREKDLRDKLQKMWARYYDYLDENG